MKNLIFCIITLLYTQWVLSNNTDSLLKQLPLQNDAGKIDIYLELANIFSNNNFDSAAFFSSTALDIATKTNNVLKIAECKKTLGNINFRSGEFDLAYENYNKSLTIFLQENMPIQAAKIYNNLGLLHQYWGQNIKAIKFLEDALNIYREEQEELLKTGPFINIGLIHYRSGDYTKATKSFIKAHEIAEKHNENNVLLNTSNNLGAIYLELGNYSKALDYYEKSINYASQLSDMYSISVAKNNIGIVYEELGNFNLAVDYFLESLKINKEIKAKSKIPINLIKLGDIYSEWEKNEIALDYYFEAAEKSEILKDKLSQGNALKGIANIYIATNLYSKSLDYLKEAICLYEQINSKKEIAETYCLMGDLYSNKLKNFNKADKYFNLAEKILIELNTPATLSKLYYFIASNSFNKKDYKKCTQLCYKSIKLRPHNINHQYKVYYLLSQAYKKENNYLQSSFALEKALFLKDSITINERLQKSSKIETIYKLQQKEQQIDLLRQKTFTKNIEIKKKESARNLFITFSIILILVICIILFFFRKILISNKKLSFQQQKIEQQKNELQKANSDLEISKIEAENLSKFKNQFLANISHEIRTPLNAISGYAKLIDKNLVKETNKKYITNVIQSSENLLVIINDLLDFSRIEAGKMVIESVEFNPLEIISQTISTLKFRSEEKKIQLEIHMDPNFPNSIIGDPYRLSQILINLITNAIKFSDEGQMVCIDCKCEIKKENCLLTFNIIDQGIGIREDKLATIFESFTQVHSDTARNNFGTGLGLAIVKRLIDLQNGTISVKSKVGKGSDFMFSIPYKSTSSNNLLNNENKKHALIGNGKNNRKILLVEDNEINQELAKDTILSWKEGFVIDIAENGKEALEMIQANDYSVILMDIQMPIMDGHETTIYIRSKLPEPKCNLPIIGMTAHAMSTEKELALKNGMNEYIIKPFNPEELKQKILSFVKEE